MKELLRRGCAGISDLRTVVALGGVILSIVLHELFHIIIHWSEITNISLFPDANAIAEVIFAPIGEYDLVVEEAIAYTITMITLIMTAMLVAEIHDARDRKTVQQTVLPEYTADISTAEASLLQAQLSKLLGIDTVASSSATTK